MRPSCAVGFIVFLLLVSIAHSREAEVSDEPTSPSTYKLEEVSFLLERGFCHGECPIYSVEVLGNGTVFYNGERHVRVEGQEPGFVTYQQVLQLLDAFYDAGFQDFKSAYHSKGETRVDDDGQVSVLHVVTKGTPRMVVTLRIGDYSKRVSFQAGYAPKELIDLAEFIDEVVDTEQWISREPKGND